MVGHGPQIKNDDQYDALRDEGMSKKKPRALLIAILIKLLSKAAKPQSMSYALKSSCTIKLKSSALAAAQK
ncbi:hypothetical protein AN395_02736 [Pseudoalteromonas sp. P1-30]|uniref:DUF7218 family protein n=1 Tax=Pseudoalteromonas sp. P1-30 TaxID=1723760 RepID=UPI000707C5AE|nr:Rho termination factor [Pseudoalteromonas sp. P1-30]KPV90811.1 hypothetical protein AN395_02736 [Pseudoalteromonas sp. P1-30]